MKIDNSMSKPAFSHYYLFTIVFLSVILLIISGCGAPATDDTYSPNLVSVYSRGGCNGGEDDQFIAVELVFDQSVRVTDEAYETLRITIGGERVDDGRMDISVQDSNTVQIVIPVEKVTSGVLRITPKDKKKIRGLTDKSGQYAVRPFSVETIVPSGVELNVIQSEEELAEAEVTSTANHRSIAWIRITADGEPVTPDGSGTDIMDDAVAVHEHDFLWATEESTASDIAETVRRYYPDRLTAESEGNRVIVRSVGQEVPGVLNIEIYTY